MLNESLTHSPDRDDVLSFGVSPLQDVMMSINNEYGFDEYLKDLGISEADLRGLVLDIGSGKTERFSKTAAKRGISVVSVNPRLVDEVQRERVKSSLDGIDWQRRSVAALAQNLPFRDESFDTIVSHFAVPLWIMEEKDIATALREAVRVLKPGGKAYLGPTKPEYTGEARFIQKLDLGNNVLITLEDHPLAGKDYIIKIERV
ncbi:hypothetical protein A3F29_02805 [Candidatus Roizmanbacteria bacterium RIFCSPHIGHO2_12_FULL_33_9]|uniref:Methyltransferase type 11 domain-containing protein n=1 Tax=Candidatus Roizmanbacteria bacterium RIFCSPHIGHO2_12_FULL_33_9 TaxID=1802045 RepID=A0A1F7HK22_9BACT|nr:MAG: hypothetical protein A3F29_02805 [Candidatus Roizmanbacteria bacterium RIFCSPHIGHO2_12_FULL_33_9]